MFLLFELIYSFLQSSSVNTASHGPLSHVEINSYGNLSKSKTFYRTTVLKFKKLESERICPCILHWHPASKAFRLAYLRKTHARLLPEYIISNRSLIGRELATAGYDHGFINKGMLAFEKKKKTQFDPQREQD